MTAQPLPDDVTTASGTLGGVPTLEITTAVTRSDTVSLASTAAGTRWDHHAPAPPCLATWRGRAGAKVVSVDYRLAPEHPPPAALQDAHAAYRALLDSGVSPNDVAMVGESAGEASSSRRLPHSPTRDFRSQQPPCSSPRGPTSRSAGKA